MRVAVTGARGRLGRALIEALENAPFTGTRGPIPWSRPDLDLDTLTMESVAALIERDKPEIVIHAAAWTDVDGCARDPDLALRRNADATGYLAQACADRGIQLVLVSTNEVFDGERRDGRGYGPDDPRRAINAYGLSKLAAEALVEDAASQGAAAAIARTSWLHGPPGNDFPEKIARAALRARDAGEPLRVVGDEIGTPDLHAGRRRRDRRAHLGERPVRRHGHGDDPPPRQRRPRLEGRLGARGPPGDEHRCRDRGGSRLDLAARQHPAPVGRPRAHAAPVGRADARLAARVRGRGPGPEAGARASRLKRRASI